jgi:hypothetical protein
MYVDEDVVNEEEDHSLSDILSRGSEISFD